MFVRFELKVFMQIYGDFVVAILLNFSLNWYRTGHNDRQHLKFR